LGDRFNYNPTVFNDRAVLPEWVTTTRFFVVVLIELLSNLILLVL
jgi:hypothetical protein